MSTDAGARPLSYPSSDHFSALHSRESSFDIHQDDIVQVHPGMDSNRALNAPSKDNIEYRLYPARFYGLAGIVVLNVVVAMAGVWFGPISDEMVDDFGITLNQVNWLSNIVSLVFLPVSLAVPRLCQRFGLRRCFDMGVLFLIISAWVRYAGTITSLSKNSAYALLMLGQFFSSVSEPIFLVVGPKFSETWFDLEGRVTATMLIAVGSPVGGALGQIISPAVISPRKSILVLAIIFTAASPCLFLIKSAPPTPPTYSGGQPSGSLTSLLRALFGMKLVEPRDAHQNPIGMRERFDFLIIILLFGVFVGISNTFSMLTGQYFIPEGYSSLTAGLFGATLLLTGIAAAIVTAPLFDRILARSMATAAKVLAPILGTAWLGVAWAVRPRHHAVIYLLMTIIGISSVSLLPIGLELGVELTRNADASSAILWFAGNAFSTVFIHVEGALRAPDRAHVPLNMHRALFFHGIFAFATGWLSLLLRGEQHRRDEDESHAMQHGAGMGGAGSVGTDVPLQPRRKPDSTGSNEAAIAAAAAVV